MIYWHMAMTVIYSNGVNLPEYGDDDLLGYGDNDLLKYGEKKLINNSY